MKNSHEPDIVDRIALGIFDRLEARGVPVEYAAAIAQAVRTEITNAPDLHDLFVKKVIDHAGEAHAVVCRSIQPGDLALFRFNIRGLRQMAEAAA